MSIKAKLIFAFAMLLALVGSQALITISQVSKVADTAAVIATKIVDRIEHVSHVSTDLVSLRGLQLALLTTTSGPGRDQQQAEIRALLADTELGISQYSATISNPDRLAKLGDFRSHFQAYEDASNQMLDLVGAGRIAEAQALFQSSEPDFTTAVEVIHGLRHDEYADARDASAKAADVATTTRVLFLTAFLLVALIEMGLAWYMAGSISTGLNALVEGTRRIAQGDFTQPVWVQSQDEFADLARSLNVMVDSLRESQEENLRLSAEALRMREERIRLLRESLTRVVKAQEDERQRVARELHDQAGQALTALQYGLSRLERQTDSPRYREELEELRELTVATINEVRNLALDLRPSGLDELGLVPALRTYVGEFSKRIGVPIELQVTGLRERLPAEMETTIFRVVQEGLTNIAKHAQANRATVTIGQED
ncbi:MAG: MCP four helix bundle domain-containing protein, partial [Chloroflexi bacterium]|nr:MCP four helix bundle domain-containing protein [Chloroflexota bacterium]